MFYIPWNNTKERSEIVKKGLVYAGGEWVKGTILSESGGVNATVQIHLEDGRDLSVPQQDVIVLDQDYQTWAATAQFLATTIYELRGGKIVKPASE